LVEKTDLTTSDLGRHIKNGEIILTGSFSEKWGVLTTNFYSYIQAKQGFVNHHWGSGVVFFILQKLFGFAGLSIIYLFLFLATAGLFFYFTKKESDWFWAGALSLIFLPLITYRGEVRPEIFTYLFSGVFYVLLWHWHKGKIGHKKLLVLPIILLFWVNFHIGFVFGLFLIGAFGIDQLVKYKRKKPNGFRQLSVIGGLSAAALIINPNFVKGLLYPFNIFREYGYAIVENQSILDVHRLNFNSGIPLGAFYFVLAVLILSFVLLLIRSPGKISLANAIIAFAFAVLAIFGVRNFTVFALFALPISAINFKQGFSFPVHKAYKYLVLMIGGIIILVGMVFIYKGIKQKFNGSGFGLALETEKSLEFLRQNKIEGPIFNNYDVGGYLIYGGYDVFVDNRPEAYSVSFFEDTYVPMQQEEAKWEQVDKQYNFNAIFFSHRDFTPWAQDFLIARVKDNNWAPVYADDYNIIFLKKNTKNIGIIQEYYIPPENFQVVPY